MSLSKATGARVGPKVKCYPKKNMRRISIALLQLLGLLLFENRLHAQSQRDTYTFTTLAGMAEVIGFSDGTGSNARFTYPYGLAVDRFSNVYVSDTQNYVIRKIDTSGVVSTFAGVVGSPGSDDGTIGVARFNESRGIAVDLESNVYVVDLASHTIRKISTSGLVTTVAGLAGSPGSADGIGSEARFFYPTGVAVDLEGNLYVVDQNNNTIRKIDPSGAVVTLAGLAGNQGSDDGAGTDARFNYPYGIAVAGDGNIFVADQYNHTIRKITPSGYVTTFAGSAGTSGTSDGVGSDARFNYPTGLAVDAAGNLFVSDYHSVRKISATGIVSTLAGGTQGFADGTGGFAQFNSPAGIAVDLDNQIYVADTGNQTIRVGVSDCAALTFFDNFDRPDSSTVGNGWRSSQDSTAVFEIIQNKVSSYGLSNFGGIYRPFKMPSDQPVTVSVDFGEGSGYGGIPRSYGPARVVLFNNGTNGSGYGISLDRSDINYQNSTINLIDNAQVVQTVLPNGQFGALVHVELTFYGDGRIVGKVESDGVVTPLSFPPRAIMSNGRNVALQRGLPDSRVAPGQQIKPTIDNFFISRPCSRYFAYIANGSPNTVSVIDTSTNQVVSTIPVGNVPYAVAVNPTGTRVYVANTGDTSVSVIDAVHRRVIATVEVGLGPRGISLSPSGDRAYVVVTGTNSLVAFDTATFASLGVAPVSGGHSVAVSPDGSKAYVSNNVDYATTVTVVDTASMTVTGVLPVGVSPVDVATSLDGNFVYAVNNQSYSLSVVNAVTGASVATISLAGGASGVAVSPSDEKIYATASNGVTVVDPVTNSVVQTIAVGSDPYGIAFTPDGSSAYVANGGSGTVTVINASTGVAIATIPVGAGPYSFGKFIGPVPPIPPVVADLLVNPNPAPVSRGSFEISARAFCDGKTVSGARYTISDSSGIVVAAGSMLANDLAFDSADESMSATIASWSMLLAPGVFQVSVIAIDSAGIESDVATSLLAVYDPSGGFVTGGGWIHSAAGAYRQDTSIQGRASFGFVSKYLKGASVPSGHTEFQFRTAGLNFSSDSYEWLVVNQGGRNAQFKGSGTVNGSGRFGFMIWATDAGAGGTDSFRISIWNRSDGDRVIYDNGTNQSIGGGSIIVHQPK